MASHIIFFCYMKFPHCCKISGGMQRSPGSGKNVVVLIAIWVGLGLSRAGSSSAFCDGRFGPSRIVLNPTYGKRFWQEQLHLSFALASNTRIGPNRIFMTCDRICDPVFGLPRQLATPFCLEPVVGNDSRVLNSPFNSWPFHFFWAPMKNYKYRRNKNASTDE